MRVLSIVEAPDFIPLLARWHFDEWHDLYADWSFEQALGELRVQTDPNRIPLTLVAVNDNGELLGSVSLLTNDLPGYEHLSPWLASLFVRPEQRGEGIGSELVRQAIATAQRLNVPRLYLFTPQHEAYYAARGWQTLEYGQAGGNRVGVMMREISTSDLPR